MTDRVQCADGMVDCHKPGVVEIEVSEDGTVWVNVDCICRFRAYHAAKVFFIGPGHGKSRLYAEPVHT